MALRARKTETPDSVAPSPDNASPAALQAGDNLGVVVGLNIKRLRSRRNLSLEGLAKISGVSRAMLGQIETGRSVPTINVVWKIACAFGVPFSTLIASQNADAIRVITVKEAKLLTSANGDFTSRALFPFDGERRTEFYELRLKGQRHRRGRAACAGHDRESRRREGQAGHGDRRPAPAARRRRCDPVPGRPAPCLS